MDTKQAEAHIYRESARTHSRRSGGSCSTCASHLWVLAFGPKERRGLVQRDLKRHIDAKHPNTPRETARSIVDRLERG